VAEEGVVTTPGEPGVVIFQPTDLSALVGLARFLELHAEPTLPLDREAPLPEEDYRALVRVVEALREGKAITVLPQTERLRTQEIADFLRVSRATLVQLLNQGKILYDQSGRHRRLLFSDFRRYVEQRREERTAAPEETTEADSDDDLYGVRPENYAAVLRKARIERGDLDRPDGPR
jgi:excisionase family DNA binding protein